MASGMTDEKADHAPEEFAQSKRTTSISLEQGVLSPAPRSWAPTSDEEGRMGTREFLFDDDVFYQRMKEELEDLLEMSLGDESENSLSLSFGACSLSGWAT